MIIPADKCIMAIRFAQYRNVDFINELETLITKFGSAWMLKVGRKIPESSLNRMMEESRLIILKAPKVVGGEYFIASCASFHNGNPLPDFRYPIYYSEMIRSSTDNEFTFDGTWLEITEIKPLPTSALEHMKMLKSDKKLDDVIRGTRTSTLYAICRQEIAL